MHRIPIAFSQTCRRLGIPTTRFVLSVIVHAQQMHFWEFFEGDYRRQSRIRISTSRFGLGQEENSNCTPLGLHRVAAKIGGGWPVGAVFKSRRMVGYTWAGMPGAAITHRILWLEGLEPGFNRGANVDTFSRYIYIHGTGEEPTLGRPASRGCIHLAAADLIPLFDMVPQGTLVWIGQ